MSNSDLFCYLNVLNMKKKKVIESGQPKRITNSKIIF